GEAMDDGCANEISLYESEFDGRLQLLLTNVDFSGKSKENTFSLTKSDAMEMAEFLMKWAKNG
ncbi:MAG: hypothetical protein Q3959_05810, partial [Limosilactobacillus sp.]|uniref:hypothetical protein n=1 Tax=Limosilactobacillus sp. TaxID=2773925 RepID=UPI00270880ED|nr:hypothetical protein [Limosilactobacillus sp.]